MTAVEPWTDVDRLARALTAQWESDHEAAGQVDGRVIGRG